MNVRIKINNQEVYLEGIVFDSYTKEFIIKLIIELKNGEKDIRN